MRESRVGLSDSWEKDTVLLGLGLDESWRSIELIRRFDC
jgi:hypothetical protein